MFSLKGMIINEVKHFSTDRQTKSEIAEKIEKATKYINDHWEQTLSAERGDGYLALEDLIKKVINILEDRQVPPEEFYDLPIAKIFFKDEKFNQSFEALILFESFDLSLSAEDAEIQIADRIESEKSKVMDISNGSNNNRGALITFLESYLPSKPKQENEIPFTTNEHKGIGLAVTLKFPVD
ncbi:MAG: hypothetical protein JSS53_02405, partial [Proteobacteria bacterium]|nr:hypothetical protein [Pseudomonadota bacterium]